MLLPESIESVTVLRTGLQSTRRIQVFSNYRRFLTSSRIRWLSHPGSTLVSPGWLAAIPSTSRSLIPSSFALCAERMSIAGSRRAQPVTIAWWRLASARKRTMALSRLRLAPRAVRLLFRSAGAGCVSPNAFSARSRVAMVLVDLGPVSQVKGDGAIDLIELAREHALQDTRREALQRLIESDHSDARALFERALKKIVWPGIVVPA
jgi:hypothetical protein